MYPLNAILIGCDEQTCSARAARAHEPLGRRRGRVSPTLEVPIDVLRKSPGEKRLLIFHCQVAARDSMHWPGSPSACRGWPVVVLMGEDDHPNGSRGNDIIGIMRAGASQIVSLPFRPDDFKAALDRIAVQFVDSAHGYQGDRRRRGHRGERRDDHRDQPRLRDRLPARPPLHPGGPLAQDGSGRVVT